jgi:hypothetical protein
VCLYACQSRRGLLSKRLYFSLAVFGIHLFFTLARFLKELQRYLLIKRLYFFLGVFGIHRFFTLASFLREHRHPGVRIGDKWLLWQMRKPGSMRNKCSCYRLLCNFKAN